MKNSDLLVKMIKIEMNGEREFMWTTTRIDLLYYKFLNDSNGETIYIGLANTHLVYKVITYNFKVIN